MLQKLLLLTLLMLAAGCAPTRTMTITANPSDAILKIDDVDRGPSPITQMFTFEQPNTVHRVTASRAGYRDKLEVVTLDPPVYDLVLNLQPETRRINVRVEPAAAIIKLDGKPLSPDPVTVLSAEVELGVDARNLAIQHTLSAERDNFQPARRVISRLDQDLAYVLKLEPMKKMISINTEPGGAEIFLDQTRLGVSPLTGVMVDLPVDLETNEFEPRKLRARKAGYEAGEVALSWDEGRTDYRIDLGVKSKEARLFIDPPDATVKIDGTEIPNDASGILVHKFSFTPTNERGDLKTYEVSISKKKDDSEWEPQHFILGWDDGRIEYRTALKEILTTGVKLLSPVFQRDNEGWKIISELADTIATKDSAEPIGRPRAKQITQFPKGTQLGSLALAPDGSKIAYTVLSGSSGQDLRSQIFVVNADGSGDARAIGDGKAIDLMPAFTPGGDQIVFSSNRDGNKRFKIYSIATEGTGQPVQLSVGDTTDLWPVVDSDPMPRLFYQAMFSSRTDSRLQSLQIGTSSPADLTSLSGTRPRVSPRNDAVVFCALNNTTGRREIYIAGDKGGTPRNLTKTPDADEYDPSFSRDGSRIIFASDRAADDQGRRNYDIWMIDLARPETPIRLTRNGSLDDSPVLDVLGDGVYFRSNRGGQWQIWRVPIR